MNLVPNWAFHFNAMVKLVIMRVTSVTGKFKNDYYRGICANVEMDPASALD